MTAEDKKPPAFFCPECGQKHRADLGRLLADENAVAKINCAGCGIGLAVSLGEDGLPDCKTAEAYVGAQPVESPPEPKSKAAPVSKGRRGRKGGGKAKGSKEAEGESAAPKDKAPAKDEAIDAEFSKGDHVDRYEIESVLGQGGTSTVYAAFDPTTNRQVALKVFDKDQSDTMQQRFLREIEVQANIRHQNIMPVFDRGSLKDGRPYFTMELLYKPWTLSKLIEHRERGTLGRYATLKDLMELPILMEKVLIPVCDGVYVANIENAVIHRDLKPDNVLIDSRTLRPYVIDFGICEAVETKTRIGTGPVIAPTVEDAGIVGTPRFLSPEQAKGNVNSRTDVWGLGALLFFMIAGEPPIAGAVPITRAELKRRIQALEDAKAAAVAEGNESRIALCDEKLGRLQDPGLRTMEQIFRDARDGTYGDLPKEAPAPVVAVVQKAMSKVQSDRYVNARQLSAELGVWMKGGTVRALSSAGGAGAAMHSARLAIRANLMTAVLILVSVGAGLFLGKMLAGGPSVGASTRTDDALADVEQLEASIVALAPEASALTPIERHRIWHILDASAERIKARLADEPATDALSAVKRRLHYVRGRMSPPRVVIDVPAGTQIHAKSTITNEAVALQPGENALRPGAYHVSLGDTAQVQFPISVPFVVRAVDAKPELEPAIATYKPSVRLDDLPSGMILVLGGRVAPRGLPYAEPSSTLLVAPFLMDRNEVTNEAYERFLLSLPDAERASRTPSVGFVPESGSGVPTMVKGKEGLPVVGIRPSDAAAFAAWRGKQDGAVIRLPREEEWVLAAGAAAGFALPNGALGLRTEGNFAPPLKRAGVHQKDRSPYGVRGLFANAREIVIPAFEGGAAYVVKGAGVGDDPDQGATYAFRPLAADSRHETTGFRCVREIASDDG